MNVHHEKSPTDGEHGPCPECGLQYLRGYAPDERYHRTVHDEALHGPRTKLADGVYFVTHGSMISEQRLAQSAAIAARRETQYDFASYEAVKKKADKYKTIVAMCVRAGRVCGLIVSRDRECKFAANVASFQADGNVSWLPEATTEVESRSRRAIDMVWVLKEKRRQGIAKMLAFKLASRCGVKIEEFAHMVPFRRDAVKLWNGLGIKTLFLV